MKSTRLTRYLLGGICGVFALCTMVACSNSETATELTMQDVYDSVAHESFLAEYDSYEITTTYTDGTYDVIYGNSELRSLINVWSTRVYSLSTGYMLELYDGNFYAFAGDLSLDEVLIVGDTRCLTASTVDEIIDEYVISGDTHIITTILTDDEANAVLTQWELEYTEGDSVKTVYSVDASTNLMVAIACYHVNADGETLISDSTVAFNQEPSEEALEILDVINATEDVREATLIINPNMDDEIVLQSTVPAGYTVAFSVPDNCPVIYQDEACTIPLETAFDLTEDICIYTLAE